MDVVRQLASQVWGKKNERTIAGVCEAVAGVEDGKNALPETTPRGALSQPPVDGFDPSVWAQPRLARKLEVEKLLAGRTRGRVDFGKLVRTCAGDVTVSLLTIAISQSINQAFMEKQPAGVHASLLSSMGMMSLGPLIGQQISMIVGKVAQIRGEGDSGYNEHLRAVHHLLMKKYEAAQREMPVCLASAVEEEDLYTDQVIKEKDPSYANVLLKRRQSIFFSWPTRVVNVSCREAGGDLQRGRSIDDTVAALLQECSPENQATLGCFIDQIRANSILAKASKTQAYLEGPPGTGKTRFAHRLSQSLGLPLCVIKASDSLKYTLLDPAQASSGSESLKKQGSFEEQGQVGMLPAALLEAGILNPIILIDEVGSFFNDPSMVEFLKRLLDPDCLDVRIRSLNNMNLDISRCTLILTGNSPMTDTALSSRVKRVTFSRLDPNNKRRAVKDALVYEVKNNSIFPKHIHLKLSEEVARIEQKVLDKDEVFGVPGVRTAIEVAKELLSFHRSFLLKDKVISSEQENDFLDHAYRQRVSVTAALEQKPACCNKREGEK